MTLDWDNVLEWTEEDLGELERLRIHHPKCEEQEEPIEEGRTPRFIRQRTRIDWMDSESHFGHQCKTGVVLPSRAKGGTRAERAKLLAGAISRIRSDPEDQEARATLMDMSTEELANVVLGSGAQKMAAIKLMTDLAQVDIGLPQVSKEADCPIGQGEIDCPSCGARHQPVEVHVSDELYRSLKHLGEIQEEDVAGEEMARDTDARIIDVGYGNGK